MKKILAMAIGLAAIASIASAAEATYSKNAVGFINIEATGGKLYALSMPLDNMAADDGLWNFEELQLAKDAAAGTTVYFWDGTGWTPFSKKRNGTWGITEDFAKLQPGQCFFFEPVADMLITMAGEVPDSEVTVVPVAGAARLTAVGNPYPTPISFQESALATAADIGATVYFWDGTGWTPFSKKRNGTWGITEDFTTLQPGYGFFFEGLSSSSPIDWEVQKGYEWP